MTVKVLDECKSRSIPVDTQASPGAQASQVGVEAGPVQLGDPTQNRTPFMVREEGRNKICMILTLMSFYIYFILHDQPDILEWRCQSKGKWRRLKFTIVIGLLLLLVACTNPFAPDNSTRTNVESALRILTSVTASFGYSVIMTTLSTFISHSAERMCSGYHGPRHTATEAAQNRVMTSSQRILRYRESDCIEDYVCTAQCRIDGR